jgi:hypothetical protein
MVKASTLQQSTNQVVDAVAVPQGLSYLEAQFVLDRLRRLKDRRFGRLVIAVSDGRVVDVEVIEKVDREILNRF